MADAVDLQAQVGPYHTNTAEGLKLSRRILVGQKKDMRQFILMDFLRKKTRKVS